MMRHLGVAIAAGTLLLQAVSVVRAQFVDQRYFCWAPHTTQVRFKLDVDVAGRRLSPREAQTRYHLTDADWESHAAQNLIDTVRMYESTYGRGDAARVHLTYRINEGTERQWQWP